MPSKLDPFKKQPKPQRDFNALRVLLGLAVVGGAILWSFNRRAAEIPKPTGAVTRGPLTGETEEIKKIIAADRAFAAQSADVLHMSNKPRAELATEAQIQIVNCMARADEPLVTGDIAAIKSLDDLQKSLALNEVPHKQRLTEVVTFQTNEQIKDGKKYRAKLAPADTGTGQLDWQLYEIGSDGLPDLLELPETTPKRAAIKTLLSRAQVLEHDREELYTWTSGATAEVKLQDEVVTEIALRFDKSLLGCATVKSTITCKCL